MDFESR